MNNPRLQKLIDQDSVIVRFLRDQAIPCSCCGELFNAGDQVILHVRTLKR
jgi:hypothetical protein